MLDQLHLNPHLLTVPANIGGKPTEEVQQELGLSEMIRLGSNENAWGPSPLALAAFREALKEAHRYPGVGDRQLRCKLAERYNARYAAAFTADNFMTGNGLSDVLRMIAHAFLFDGGEAVYCIPTFPLYGIFARMFGATTVAVPHDHFAYNLPAIADAITPQTRVIFVCNPNNPTGTIVTPQRVDALMARVPPSAVVVFDESYYDFVGDLEYTNSIEYLKREQDNVIVLRSFSKVYGMANLRIGYAIATRPMIEYLAHAQIVYNTSDAVLQAATAALDDERHLQATRQFLAREREFLCAGLEALSLDFVPTHTNFVLLINLPLEVKRLDRELLQRGIIVRPMGGFGMPDAVRVTIGKHEENEALLRALEAILTAGGDV